LKGKHDQLLTQQLATAKEQQERVAVVNQRAPAADGTMQSLERQMWLRAVSRAPANTLRKCWRHPARPSACPNIKPRQTAAGKDEEKCWWSTEGPVTRGRFYVIQERKDAMGPRGSKATQRKGDT